MDSNFNLTGLLSLVERWDGLPSLLARLGRGERVAVAPVEGAKSYLLAALAYRLGVPVLVVTARPGRAREMQEQIAGWSGLPGRVLLFPEPDALPYERMPEDPSTTAARLQAMSELAAWHGSGAAGDEPPPYAAGSPPVVVTSGRAMMERIMPPRDLARSVTRLRVGDRIPWQATLNRWMELGYEPVPVVEAPGSFSRRGGILDLYPPGSLSPFRIELFGDDVESIRLFDPATQRSTEKTAEVVITPPHELLPPSGPEVLERLRQLDLSSCTPQARERLLGEMAWLAQSASGGDAGTRGRGDAGKDPLITHDSSLITRPPTPNPQPLTPDLGFYRPFLSESTLLDYLPEGGLLVLDDPSQIAAVTGDLWEQSLHLQIQAAERGEIPPGLPPALVPWGSHVEKLPAARTGILEMRYDPGAEELPFEAPPSYGGKVKLVLDEALALADSHPTPLPSDPVRPTPLPSGEGLGEGRRSTRQQETEHPSAPPTHHSSLITHHSSPRTVVLVSQQSQRLAELLAERDRHISPEHALTAEPLPGLHLVHGALRHGWSSDELNSVVLGDAEIFGWTKAHRVVRHRSAPREAFLSDIEEGDLAVHVEHGIGRFRGLLRMPSDGQEREYLVLEYAEGDRLYVPVDQVDRVGRYVGAGEEVPSLSRLGTSDWTRAKERVKNSVRNVAKELLRVYSARQSQPGHAFSPDTPWQGELEAAFPYVETPDQLQAIHEVKADMETARPMDRLICGDVGYGKTEVALRAAFKAVTDGKQVAVLVPTTVLAQQHYNTFRERLQAYPVNVEVLSRFRSEKEQRQVLEGISTGAVDICIGTHRLIQKDIHFKELGLVIVDEEQRFGVMHKERLKQLRQQVDVLTLSATPIPRTLHMSLAGIRDMSTMETAPEDRLPIRTFVADYSDSLVREAILREIDRGGQVYFVHNRVHNIHFIADHLRRLVPEARVVVGHGQMHEDSLEKVMLEFADGQHDILVCSTIIESGLDIPNVNTIVVNQADRFGLAQLYQLRGRVGRGANRAYAYFLHARDKQLTEPAEKRLKTIFENTALGSGFRIAMKDLEIRGAGNLLGVEQHGQLNAVGFDLYTRMLADAVAELQGKPVEVAVEVGIDLPLAAHLPPDYVADEAARLSLYQRLAGVKKEEELGGLVEELQDRFGPLPVEAQNLLYMVNLKLAAARIGVSAISTVEDEIVLKLDGIPLPVRSQLLRRYGTNIRVLSNQVRLQRGRGEAWVPLLQEVVESLGEAATTLASAARG